MTATQVAVALDAIVAALRVALPDVVTVYDGQPISMDDPDVIVIGWSADRAAVEIAQQISDLGGGRSEVLTVFGLASAMRGESDGDFSPVFVRGRAVELLDLLVEVLDVDPTLGGVVSMAELAFASAMDQAQTLAGASATVEFALRVETL